ncbi:MAG TPA: glycosyl hydrolase family 18 protein [Patescibacteria group bacterium]
MYIHSKKTLSVITPSFHNVTSPTPEIPNKKETDIFVPYWSINNQLQVQNYNKVIYFGLTASADGIDTSDNGYKNLNRFVSQVQNKQTILCLTLINQDFNDLLLDNKQLQQKIIAQSIAVAKENNFSGILLDFEFNALGFDQVIKNINDFYSLFSSSIKKENLEFDTTMYGDAFYRSRPYDIKKIASVSDTVFVMAYDLHKANGDVGPNFPLNNSDYDLKKMTDDFLQVIPSKKINIVFGLYGYDWKITDNGNSIGKAAVITDAEINAKFYPSCPFTNCQIKNDQASTETHITYIDTSGQKHSLWFDSLNSVSQKQQYLYSRNIMSSAFWAYGYF